MKRKLNLLLIKLKDFWECFRPCIIDFFVIGLLGFMIYWTRWRK